MWDQVKYPEDRFSHNEAQIVYHFQADYALKYKTGISAPRLTKKVSEYQKQFQWKAGIPPSPLIGAEQVWSFCSLGLQKKR